MTVERQISVLTPILDANERLAAQNRRALDLAGILGLNLMGSPGAGKTSVLENTFDRLPGDVGVAVIEGDIASQLDADRVAVHGVQAAQINTEGGCHLDASMVQEAITELDLSPIDLLLVENVGNLVCPAGFALGTHHSVLVASVPEGDDKPYKYPGMFQSVEVILLNKIDLLPYVRFDMDRFTNGITRVNPAAEIIPLSCETGEGIEGWISWLVERLSKV